MPDFQSDTSSKQVIKNGVFVLIKFATYTAIGLFFVPYLVGAFGTTGYGLIALAGILTQYIGLVSGSIGHSVNRYLMVELNNQNHDGANEIFNSATVTFVGLFALQLPLFALGIWKLDLLIAFPKELAWDVRYLVIANVACYGLNLFMGVFGATVLATNRLDVTSKLETAFLIVRTVALYCLLEFHRVDLKWIGHVEIVLTIVRFVVIYGLARRFAPWLCLAPGQFSKKWLRPILAMGGWMLLSNFGYALFLKTDVWILNRMVSTDLAGVYAALLVWPNFIKQISTQLSAVFLPLFTIELAKANVEKVARYCLAGSKVLVIAALTLSVPLMACPREIIHVWKPEMVKYAYLLPWMVFHLAFTVPEMVLWSVYLATDKMHLKGKNDIACGTMNVAFSIGLVVSGFGGIGVALGTAVALLIRNAALTPWQVVKILKGSFRPYAWLHLVSAVSISLAFGLSWVFHRSVDLLSPLGTGHCLLWGMLIGGGLPVAAILGPKAVCNFPSLVVQSLRQRQLTPILTGFLSE